jgi:hypothetical protein
MAPFDPILVFRVARLGIAIGGAAALVVVLVWYLRLRTRPRQD